MMNLKTLKSGICVILACAILACGGDAVTTSPSAIDTVHPAPTIMPILGAGIETDRYTAELSVRGTTAYTTTWGSRGGHPGNKVNIWDVSGNVPTLVDSVLVAGASTTGDVAISDDGSLLVVATETTGGSIAIYSLANPRKPSLISQYHSANTDPGVHTAEIGRVNGTLYGFLSIDPRSTVPARLVTLDLSNPAAPREVFTRVIGTPYVHDTFVRGGLLFLALWDAGVQIWDLGGGGKGGTPDNPVVLGSVQTAGGEVHNIWWYHDSTTGAKRYAFVGQEGFGSVGSSSSGDIHVLDLQDISKPKEVAFYHVNGAGTHNFSVDERNGVLYAAYYNGGVRAIDIRGDLTNCSAEQRETGSSVNPGRCDLRLMQREMSLGLVDVNKPIYVWGVQYLNGTVYASDMLNGIWKLQAPK